MIRRANERHSALLNASKGKKIWTSEEDLQLKALVERMGTTNWTAVAQHLTDRTGKQCRERWHNHLGNGIKKGDWSEEEDLIILTLQKHIGNQWAKVIQRICYVTGLLRFLNERKPSQQITKLLPGRTDNAVKNRFHATERAKLKGKGYTLSDDELLDINELMVQMQEVEQNEQALAESDGNISIAEKIDYYPDSYEALVKNPTENGYAPHLAVNQVFYEGNTHPAVVVNTSESNRLRRVFSDDASDDGGFALSPLTVGEFSPMDTMAQYPTTDTTTVTAEPIFSDQFQNHHNHTTHATTVIHAAPIHNHTNNIRMQSVGFDINAIGHPAEPILDDANDMEEYEDDDEADNYTGLMELDIISFDEENDPMQLFQSIDQPHPNQQQVRNNSCSTWGVNLCGGGNNASNHTTNSNYNGDGMSLSQGFTDAAVNATQFFCGYDYWKSNNNNNTSSNHNNMNNSHKSEQMLQQYYSQPTTLT